MKKNVWILCAFAIMGCGFGTTTANETDEAGFSNDSTEEGSLMEMTADTVNIVNPELVRVLDPLYRHVKRKDFPANVREEEAWMREYSQKLCKYYDRHPSGGISISTFAKADSVMNEADRLYALDPDWSTMGWLVRNHIAYTIDVFRKYGLLSQLIDCCTSEKDKELVYEELTICEKLEYKMFLVVTNLALMDYWGGSFAGIEASINRSRICKARLEMYNTILKIKKMETWEDNGTYLNPAKKMLLECIDVAIKDAEEIEDDETDSRFRNEDHKEHYLNILAETKKAIQEIPSLTERWIDHWEKMDYEFTSDGSRHSMERAASIMLIKWAGVVSTY